MSPSPEPLSRTIRLRSGVEMPALGFGTWRIGEVASDAEREVAALRRALELGFRHFDTAEMYGDGGTESLLGAALAGVPRDELFVTSKFYPWHAEADQVVAACEQSLVRLGLDHLDLYLLHWPGSTPLEDTLEGVRRLLEAGKIRAFGVSNFDTAALGGVFEDGLGELIDVNQVLYNPSRRGIEFDLLPLMREIGVACVAYTPVEPGRVRRNRAFCEIGEAMGLTPAQLSLAWHVTRGVACPIPKSATPAHVEALASAARIALPDDVLAAIDAAFPPPTRSMPLEIL